MHYQPIATRHDRGVGFEALMRWQHPEAGMGAPRRFIPLAEQSELILELGAFALARGRERGNFLGSNRCSTGRPYVTVNLPQPVPRPGPRIDD